MRVIVFVIVCLALISAQNDEMICKVTGKNKSGKEMTIDLTPLMKKDGTAYEVQNPADPFYTYHINICKEDVTCGSFGEPPQIVTACKKSPDFDTVIGILKDAELTPAVPDDIEKGVFLIYKDGQNFDETEILFTCGTEEGTLKFDEIGADRYKFKFETKYACPVKKSARGIPYLGVGGLLMIIAIIALIIYFVVGIAVNVYKYKATGTDAIPNVTFWKELPFLVVDGVKYMFSPCMGQKTSFGNL